MADENGDVSIVMVAVFLLALLATGVSVFALLEIRVLNAEVHDLHAQQPKITIVRLSDIAAEMPKKPSTKDVEKLIAGLHERSAKLAERGYLVLDDQAVFAAPERLYVKAK